MDELKTLLDQAFGLIEKAESETSSLVSWVAPNGDTFIETRKVIDDIIATGSWR